MRHTFEDGGYVELKKKDGKIILIICAKDSKDNLKKIVNAVEISNEEFAMLIQDLK